MLNGSHDTISSPSHSINYTLDAEGNFSSTQTDGGSSVTNSFNKQNEETAAGSSTLTFDNNGNLTLDDQNHTLVYDGWNRLVAVKNSGGTTLTSYKYDALGRRIVESPSGTAHDLYYDASRELLEERWAGVSTATIQYIWSPVYIDALILRDRSTLNNGTLDERLWVQQDANWNVTALINGSGTVVERYDYDPYGLRTVLDASFNVRSNSSYAFVHGFQGLRLDTTVNIYDFRFRIQLPTIARRCQPDPLAFWGGDTNFYRTEKNTSTNVTDPSGLNPNKEPPNHASLLADPGYPIAAPQEPGPGAVLGRPTPIPAPEVWRPFYDRPSGHYFSYDSNGNLYLWSHELHQWFQIHPSGVPSTPSAPWYPPPPTMNLAPGWNWHWDGRTWTLLPPANWRPPNVPRPPAHVPPYPTTPSGGAGVYAGVCRPDGSQTGGGSSSSEPKPVISFPIWTSPQGGIIVGGYDTSTPPSVYPPDYTNPHSQWWWHITINTGIGIELRP